MVKPKSLLALPCKVGISYAKGGFKGRQPFSATASLWRAVGFWGLTPPNPRWKLGHPARMLARPCEHAEGNTKGFILLMVVVAIGVVALLVTGLANLSHTEFRIRHNEQIAFSAQIAAESGLEDAMHTLSTQPLWTTGFVDKAFPSGGTDSYSVSVQNLFPYITLTATGLSGSATRQIVTTICLTGDSIPYTIRIDRWEEI